MGKLNRTVYSLVETKKLACNHPSHNGVSATLDFVIKGLYLSDQHWGLGDCLHGASFASKPVIKQAENQPYNGAIDECVQGSDDYIAD